MGGGRGGGFGERMVVVRGGGPAGQSGFAKATPRQDFKLSTERGVKMNTVTWAGKARGMGPRGAMGPMCVRGGAWGILTSCRIWLFLRRRFAI